MKLDIAIEVADGAAPAEVKAAETLKADLTAALQTVDDTIEVETPVVEESFAVQVKVEDPEPPAGVALPTISTS